MKTALIVHGKPSKEEYYNPESPSPSNRHWLPWLQKQLILNNTLAQTPEMPEPYNPVYSEWCRVMERFAINEETILVGHSCGAGFLVRWLSSNNVKVGKVALVAPWIDPEKKLKTGFFEFEIEANIVSRTKDLGIFYSTDDYQSILRGTDQIKKALPAATIFELTGKKHFTFRDLKTDQFPELRDYLIT